jgi:Secretion system C-terminal sorting domain
MKAFTIIYALLFLSYILNAQTKPEFELTIYGEDAKGNRDSIIVAYDRNTQYDTQLETTFGDVSIATKKLDSVFEMRVHKTYYIYGIMDQVIAKGDIAKHITVRYGFVNIFPSPTQICVPYGTTRQAFIMCKVKYPPLKLSWDKSRIANNPCAALAYIIDNEYETQHAGPERINYPFTYLSTEGSMSDSLTKDLHNRGEKIPYKFPDGTVDTVHTNYLIRFRNQNLLSDLDELGSSIDVKSYPNPCREVLNISMPEYMEKVRVNIHSIDGALMQATHTISSTIVSIDTGPLSMGTHVVEIIGSNGKRYVSKFVKSD